MYECRPFKVGSLHDPQHKDFYIHCAQVLSRYDLGECVSVTMDHIVNGGVTVGDYIVSHAVTCRGERLKFADIYGRIPEQHNQSFIDLEDRLMPDIEKFTTMGVLSDLGPISTVNCSDRVFGVLSAKDEVEKIRLISDIFFLNAFSKPHIQKQEKLVLDDLFAFASKFKFIFSGCGVDFRKYYDLIFIKFLQIFI